jgi:hypothetical protein
MADERRAPHSLKERSADQVRNEQRGGANSPIDPERPGGPEGNATLRRVWSEPGGEANNYRQAKTGQTSNARSDGHDELTAAETPETTEHLSDATLKPEDKDATSEAISRATVQKRDQPQGGEAASHLGQGDGTDASKSGAAPSGRVKKARA